MQIWQGWASEPLRQPFSLISVAGWERAGPWAAEGRERQGQRERGGGGGGCRLRFGMPRSRTGRCAWDSSSSRQRACGEGSRSPQARVGGACCHFLVLGKPGIAVAELLPVL